MKFERSLLLTGKRLLQYILLFLSHNHTNLEIHFNYILMVSIGTPFEKKVFVANVCMAVCQMTR